MKKLSKLIVYVVLALSPMLLSRCTLTEDLSKLKTSLDSVKLVVGTPEFNNAIHFNFNDAGTNSMIGSDIKVKVSGVGATHVYNNLGEQLTEYTAKNGMLDLVVDPNLDSLSLLATPLRFTITPQISGYLSQTQQVEVSHEKLKLVQVSLVNLNPISAQDKVKGISVSTQTNLATTNSQGATTQSNPQQVDQDSNTTIVVPSGSVLKDASGKLLTGQVNSQVVFYSGSDAKTQEIIADQLTGSVKLDTKKPNDSIQTKLISAGMYTAQITVGNETVKNFGGEGLKLKTELADTLINPETGKKIQVGDTIPMWSKEEGSGTWVLEKKSVVKKAGGKLYLEDVVNHLSTWNWDWYCASSYSSSNYCDNGPRINWKLVNFSSAYVTASVSLNSKYGPYSPLYEYITNASFTQFARTPRGVDGKITFAELYPVSGRTLTFNPASISFTDLCSLGTKDVTVTATSAPTGIVGIKFNLSAKSADPKNTLTIKPSLYIYYKPKTQTYWNYMYLASGIANISLKSGQLYDLAIIVGSNVGYGTLKIDNVDTNHYNITIVPANVSSSAPIAPIIFANVLAVNNIIDVPYQATLPNSTFSQLSAPRKR